MEILVDLDKYSIKFEKPSVEDFLILRKQIGWGELAVNQAETSLNNSLFHVIILDQSQLVGMARIVGDGAMYFYIQDVIVAPQHQNSGLGAVLMEHIERYLSVHAIKGSTVGLLAAKGKEGFYSRYGYISRPSDSLGNGMCRFV
jgi:ribosomal protein S18 acetylase RimI-like enzyme